MTQNAKTTTIIIPLRMSDLVYQAPKRLNLILSKVPADLFDVIVVDYGSQSPFREEILEISNRYDHSRVVRVDAEFDSFSIGAARDIGVQHATTPVVMFNDIDFYANDVMYRRIDDEIKSRELTTKTYDFFCVPVAWTTDLVLNLIDEMPDRNFNYTIHQSIIEYAKSLIETMVYGSSAIVTNRHNYLSIGGHNKKFYGHGAEDYDLLHRLAASCPKGPRTGLYYVDKKNNNILNYEGFRAYFATYGIDVFQRGIFFSHMWHPRRKIEGYFQSKRNFDLLGNLMTDFDLFDRQPKPLEDINSPEKTLMLIDPASRSFSSLRYAQPLMGNVAAVKEALFTKPGDLLDFVQEHNYTRVGFLNPYGNPHRLALYEAVRKAGVSYWTFDRGALPDSWFFDPNGFNADSASYAPAAWDHPLSLEDKADALDLIRDLRTSESTLEDNGPRKMPERLREIFGLGQQKVLFVPLQRPSDTVMRYFSNPVGGMDNFTDWVSYIAENVDPAEWAIVIKKHPLEQDIPPISNVFVAPADTHIYDLIELSEKVLLVNSGTGVLAMAFEKPVIYCGTPFYQAAGVNYQANSAEEALQLVQGKLSFDTDRAHRFLHHLWRRIYSFGSSFYDKIEKEDKSSLTLVKKIRFREVRGLTENPVYLGEVRTGISLDAPLFHSFGGRLGIQTAIKNKGSRPAPSAQTRIAPTPLRAFTLKRRVGILLDQKAQSPGRPFGADGFLSEPTDAGLLFTSTAPVRIHKDHAPLAIEGKHQWYLNNMAIAQVESNTLSMKAQFQDETSVDRVTFAVSLFDKSIKVTRVLVNGEPVNLTHISNGVFVFTASGFATEAVEIAFPELRKSSVFFLEPIAKYSSAPRQQMSFSDGVEGQSVRSYMFNTSLLSVEMPDSIVAIVENRTPKILNLGGTEATLQVRFKNEERRTVYALSSPLMDDIYPGANFVIVPFIGDIEALKAQGVQYSYVDVIDNAGKAHKTGRDQEFQVGFEAELVVEDKDA